MNAYSLADSGALERLNGISAVDLAANLQSALQGGCRAGAVVREMVRLRAGAGRLTPQQYFWYRLVALPGIITRSWDVALTDSGPVLLEVNFGGDLNLAQLGHGAGVLDETYAEHLRQNGYRL